MSNQRIVTLAYFATFLTLLVVLDQLMVQIWAQFQWPEYQFLGQFGLPWAIGATISVTVMIVLLRHPRVNPFLLEVVSELRQVVWPTRQEATTHTMVVVVSVVVFALILGAFDFVWSNLAKILLNPSL